MVPMANLRYVIIGAGAIGGGIGGLLAAHGVPTVLVARGAHLARMQERGLRLLLPDGERTVPVLAAAGPEDVELSADDVLVLATKTHQAEAALAQWADAPVAGGGTAGSELPVLTALNGVSAEQMALRWFRRVYGVCVWMPAALLTPGEVIVRSAPARAVLHVGRIPVTLTTEADRALLDRIAADWARAGIQAPQPDDVMAWKHRKLLGNLGNAVQALLGAGDEEIVAAARAEGQEVFAAAGVVMNSEDDEREYRAAFDVRPVPGAPDELGGSTWQSMTRRSGATEADYLNGEIARMAHTVGMRAPINEALARITRRASADGIGPGQWTADELRTALGL